MSKKQPKVFTHDENPPQPPQAPSADRRFKQYPYQWIGMPLIMLIPILALLGVFGTAMTTTRAEDAGGLLLDVDYVSRFRYKTLGELDVTLTNQGDAALQNVTVSFTKSYVDAFSSVVFTPSADEVTDDSYEVTLDEIPPGEARTIAVELQAEKYWRHQGEITVTAEGSEPVSVSVSTFTFP